MIQLFQLLNYKCVFYYISVEYTIHVYYGVYHKAYNWLEVVYKGHHENQNSKLKQQVKNYTIAKLGCANKRIKALWLFA